MDGHLRADMRGVADGRVPERAGARAARKQAPACLPAPAGRLRTGMLLACGESLSVNLLTYLLGKRKRPLP